MLPSLQIDRYCASVELGNQFHVLVHPTGEIFLGKLAASLVVGASIGLDAFQITGNDVFAFSWADEANVSPVHALWIMLL